MMRSLKTFTIATVCGLSAISVAVAHQKGEVSMPAAMEKTGDVVSCLSLTEVKISDPIADDAILFEMNNGDVYLNNLRGSCIGLVRNDRYSFKTSQNQICRGDMLIVANPVGVSMGSCGLGSFESLVDQSAD